jgi:hypothetical protein
MKGKIELGINTKLRLVMSTLNDIFEGEFLQYDKGEDIPPKFNKENPLLYLSYYSFYHI